MGYEIIGLYKPTRPPVRQELMRAEGPKERPTPHTRNTTML